jgi:hypothetical protein
MITPRRSFIDEELDLFWASAILNPSELSLLLRYTRFCANRFVCLKAYFFENRSFSKSLSCIFCLVVLHSKQFLSDM